MTYMNGESLSDSVEVNEDIVYSRDATRSSGYILSHLEETAAGLRAHLRLAGKPNNAYGVDVINLILEVEYQSEDRLHVHIYDQGKAHYQIPHDIIPSPSCASSVSKKNLEFLHQESPFAFWITRPSGEIIFDTRPDAIPVHTEPLVKDGAAVRDSTLPAYPLIFSDQYLQLATAVPNDTNIYGLGEVISTDGLRRDNHGTIQAFWNCDPGGNPPDRNLYGSHPFYLEHRWDPSTKSASSHGVFLRNSHGLDVILRTGVVEYRCLGGTLDLYFVAGPAPKAVIEQYGEVVGRPAQMPYWSFGFNLCRWGYKSIEETREAVECMREANIPLEVMWNDLDHMDRKRNFTTSKLYPPDKLKDFTQWMHQNHQRYVPLVDACIYKPSSPNDPYPIYEKGKKMGVFLKHENGDEFVGQVWPGPTVWPDWFHPKSEKFWHDCIAELKEKVDFDGLWLDMDEPANLPQATDIWLSTKAVVQKDGRMMVDLGLNKWDYPPYAIHSGWKALGDLTVAPAVPTSNGYRQYHSHNLYALQETIVTSKVLQSLNPGQRPFMLSRGTFAGMGRVSAHGLGDNQSTWNCIRESIQGVLQHQLYQMPMVGADVGGFQKDTTEELLNRWMQLGAFLPFYRQHNDQFYLPQEPYRWKSVAEASKRAIRTRYRLIPYWESLFAQAHQQGTPPIRPLFMEFDNPAFFAVQLQFMIGSALLVTPCVHEGETTVTGHFPSQGGTIWRDWYSHEILEVDQRDVAVIPTPLGRIPVHIRSGSIILLHTESGYTLTETKSNPLELIVSLDQSGEASGEYLLDDGLSIEPDTTRVSCSVSFGRLKVGVQGKYKIPQRIVKITVLGVVSKPQANTMESWYKALTQELVISDLDLKLEDEMEVRWEQTMQVEMAPRTLGGIS